MSNTANLETQVAELQARILELEAKKLARCKKERDYGPKSKRQMSKSMALRIIIGIYRDESVRNLADDLGFSRAQIYSLRGQYTMKDVWQTVERILKRRIERANNA